MFEYEYLLELLTKRNLEIDKLRTYKVVVNYLRDTLMKSNMAIQDVCYIMSILNYAEDGECTNNSFFYEERLTNQELRTALEVM